jgi:hypothetical protein
VKTYPGFKKFEKYVGKDLEIKEDEKDEDEIPKDLIASFGQRKSAFDNLTARLEAKYGNTKSGNKGGDEEEGGAKKKSKVAPATRKGVGMKKKKVGVQKKVKKEEEEVVSEEGEEMEV